MISGMKRRTLVIGAAGLVAMLTSGWLAWRESSRRSPQANRAVRQHRSTEPDAGPFFAARLPDLDGHEQTLSQWQGKPLVLNFWATWCAPCVKEMPDLSRLAGQHPKAQFVGVAIDTAQNVREFVLKVPVSYPIVIAGHQGIELVRTFGNTAGGLPCTVLLRPDGSIYEVIMGAVDPVKLSEQIRQLLASSAV